MLPKKFRLTFYEFQKNPSEIASYPSPLFQISIKKNQENTLRFVVVTAKYLDKRSVYRHRTKRLIIEGVAQLLPQCNKGFDISIKARKILAITNHKFIYQSLKEIFKRASLL